MCRQPSAGTVDPGHPGPAPGSSGPGSLERTKGRGGLTYMSRPFFMPLLAPEAPGRRLGRPAGKSRLRATGWLRSRVATRQAGARAPIPYLGVTTSLEGCRGSPAPGTALGRPGRDRGPGPRSGRHAGPGDLCGDPADASAADRDWHPAAAGGQRARVDRLPGRRGGGPATRPRHHSYELPRRGARRVRGPARAGTGRGPDPDRAGDAGRNYRAISSRSGASPVRGVPGPARPRSAASPAQAAPALSAADHDCSCFTRCGWGRPPPTAVN
jgi:hypothetical protein